MDIPKLNIPKIDFNSLFLGFAALILFSSGGNVQKDLLQHCGFLITHSFTYIAVVFCAIYIICRDVFIASIVTFLTILIRQACVYMQERERQCERERELREQQELENRIK